MVEDVEVHIGCSGWSYRDWRGSFYPEGLSPEGYLAYYARFFKTVEVNSTFYRLPTEKTVKSWYNQASPAFRYSLKASRYLTHIKRFKNIAEPLKHFYKLGDFLGEKMGWFLFQFPESFPYTLEKLERLLSQLDRNHQNVVGFRHQSWWNTEVFQALRAANIMFCTVSGLRVPEAGLLQ